MPDHIAQYLTTLETRRHGMCDVMASVKCVFYFIVVFLSLFSYPVKCTPYRLSSLILSQVTKLQLYNEYVGNYWSFNYKFCDSL